MINLTHLKQDRAAALDAANALLAKVETEKRALTTEEQAKWDEHMKKFDELTETITRAERAAKIEPEKSEERKALAQVHDNREDAPFEGPYPLGEQLRSIVNAAKSPYSIDPRLRGIQERAATGLGEAIPADGGFFVQKDQSDQIIQKVYDVGGLINRCRRFPISANSNGVKIPGVDESSRADGSRIGGVRGYWVDEGVAPTASKPKFFQVELQLNKVAALVYLSDELLADAALLESFVMSVAPDELRFKVEDAIVNGTGVGKPLGILQAPCLVSVAKEVGQLADTVVYENITKMWSRMYARSRANAVWFINQDVEPQLYTMGITIGTGGSPVYLPPGGASQAPYGTLFGRPVVPLEYCPTVGDTGDVLLADMSQYYLIEKGGVQSATSIHVQFLTDQSVLRFIYRIDGQPAWKDALTPKSGSTNTLSPFVKLDARA